MAIGIPLHAQRPFGTEMTVSGPELALNGVGGVRGGKEGPHPSLRDNDLGGSVRGRGSRSSRSEGHKTIWEETTAQDGRNG